MTTKLVAALRAQPPAGGETGEASPAASADVELASLSTRELEILHLIARGDSNKHIARQLDIAETTVKIHVQHILRKLHLTSRVQAAVFAARHAFQDR
jgi:two-component system, NarL family, nitrate/nitrite response regulator NarL